MKQTLEVSIIDAAKYKEMMDEDPPEKMKVKLSFDFVEVLLKAKCIKLTMAQAEILKKYQKQEQEKKASGQEGPREPTEKEMELLKSPDFFERCIAEIEKKAVGEEKAKKTIATIANLRLVENAEATSGNGAPNDQSGVGKDFVTRHTLGVFCPKHIHVTRISPTVFTYWHNPRFEPEWTWTGKVLYMEDVSGQILNCEVVKTMLSGESKAVVVIKQMSVEIPINGKPIIIVTFANVVPANEILRRIPLIPMDDSREQTRRISEFKARVARTGKTECFDKTILGAIDCLKPVKVKVPFSDLVFRWFPDTIITRTVLGRFFDYVRSFTAFYQFQRRVDEESFLVSEGSDYDRAREVFLHTVNSASLIPITKNQKRLVEIMRSMDKRSGLFEPTWFTVSELEEAADFFNRRNLYENLDALVAVGYLKRGTKTTIVLKSSSGEHPERESKKDLVAYSVAKFDDFVLPAFEEILKRQNDNTNNTSNTSNTENTSNIRDTGNTEGGIVSLVSHMSLDIEKNKKCKKCGKQYLGRGTKSNQCPKCLGVA